MARRADTVSNSCGARLVANLELSARGDDAYADSLAQSELRGPRFAAAWFSQSRSDQLLRVVPQVA